MAPRRKGLYERLTAGETILGDGGFMFQMEKRGYVKFGPCTPECVVENPEAVIQLHREFLRAGSDVMQAMTFYASEDKLTDRGNKTGANIGVTAINQAACNHAKLVAKEGDALTSGSVSQCPSYLNGDGKAKVQEEFRKQIKIFVESGLDFVMCEYFEHIEEMEWAIETCVESGKTTCATMCIGPKGDVHGVSAGECAVRMARAGAHVLGVNCHFDPFVALETMKLMKAALEEAGLKPFLMCQPLAYHTPDAGVQGFIDLPEFPFALEPRILTRWDVHRYAREAYDLGIRYIGGCCGFEPFHVRAMAEELHAERGRQPLGHEKHEMWGGGLAMHTKPWVRARANKEFWQGIQPATGRPMCPSMSRPDNWAENKH